MIFFIRNSLWDLFWRLSYSAYHHQTRGCVSNVIIIIVCPSSRWSQTRKTTLIDLPWRQQFITKLELLLNYVNWRDWLHAHYCQSLGRGKILIFYDVGEKKVEPWKLWKLCLGNKLFSILTPIPYSQSFAAIYWGRIAVAASIGFMTFCVKISLNKWPQPSKPKCQS